MASAQASAVPAAVASTCTRSKCSRQIGLNAAGLCDGHACPVPNCVESKSSTEKWCAPHAAQTTQKLPKEWAMALVNNIPVYLNVTLMTAQYNHPGPKADEALGRSGTSVIEKPRKGFPAIFIIEPQPGDLLKGWEQCLAVPDVKNPREGLCAFFYRNPLNGAIQQADPRPPPETEELLPMGWTKAFDIDGDLFFIDHDNKISSYEDPRIVEVPTPSAALPSLKNDFKVSVVKRVERSKSVKHKQVWKIGPRDTNMFKVLDDNVSDASEIPECVRNKLHNRFLDVIPLPATRVPLTMINNDPTTAYINANFVHGHDGQKNYYIAAMGPLPSTLANFWRMIWEQGVQVIVMTTGIIEKNTKKCERYWPDRSDGSETLEYGGISVRTVSTAVRQGYLISILEATFNGETRSIFHYWYNTWPDHGVPRDADHEIFVDDVLRLMMAVTNHVTKTFKKGPRPPMLVHCSAGVGRTGTFIAIDEALHRLNTVGKVDPLQIIAYLRQCRCAMVQHPQQFEFFHESCVRFCEMAKQAFEVADMDGTFASATPSAKAAAAAALAEELPPPPPKLPTREELAAMRAQEKATARKLMQDIANNVPEVAQRKRVVSEEESALNCTITFSGKSYRFVDPTAKGFMSMKDALGSGMPESLYRVLDVRGAGQVTVTDFKTYQRVRLLEDRQAGAHKAT